MLLLLLSITNHTCIQVRGRGFSCAHAGDAASYNTENTAVSASAPQALSGTGLMTLNTSGPQNLGEIRPLVLGTNKISAPNSAGGDAVTNVGCYRDVIVRSGYERKISSRLKAGNATFETISEVSLDQSAARGARFRAFAPVAPEESSGRSANCSKSRRSSQLEKLRPSRAASVRAKASRSARNDTLVWVLPRARTPWRLLVLGVLTPHHPRNLITPQ